MHLDVGFLLPIVRDFLLCENEKGFGVQGRACGLGRGHRGEHLLGLRAQLRRDAAIQLDRQPEEVLAVARPEHLPLQLALLGAQQVTEGEVLDARDVDGRELGGGDVRVGVEFAIGELRVGCAAVEVCRARLVGVDRGHFEQEEDAGGQLSQGVVDGQVGGAKFDRGGCHGSRSSSVSMPGRVAARLAVAQAIFSSSGTPVHSSMKVFLNSRANTQPTRG